MKATAIFTIGHSSHAVATFLKLLADNAIQVVVDVRSAPYSRYVPQFNKRDIEKAICQAGLKYIFMGNVIGGKPSDLKYMDINGKVDYEKITASKEFQGGVDRLVKGFRDGWMIALLCAEENPLQCHRHLLIARELELHRNVPVWHLRSDGSRIRAKEYLQEIGEQLRLF